MRRFSVISFILSIAFNFSIHASAAEKMPPASKAPEGAEAYIVSPKDGETVSSPVHVVFGLKNMGVAPAGVKYPNSGHHHLIIDAPLPAAGKPVPADDNHVHFGKGQTETMVKLKPGKHTLQLILGDHLHIPHNPPVSSKKITITVK